MHLKIVVFKVIATLFMPWCVQVMIGYRILKYLQIVWIFYRCSKTHVQSMAMQGLSQWEKTLHTM